MTNAIRLKSAQATKQAGERARIKIVRGPDTGAIYAVVGSTILIGRGEECDIALSDLKTSRRHAQMVEEGLTWKVKDLGSANGILWNGLPVKLQEVKSQDLISLGDTQVQFILNDLMLLGQDLKPYQQVKRPPVPSKPAARPFILVGALGIIGWVLFTGTNESSKTQKKNSGRVADAVSDVRDLANYSPSQSLTQMKRDAETFFQFGFREFREKNYLRAKLQFETVLQISPGHSLARAYLAETKKAIDEEIDFHLTLGKKDDEIGKVREAKAHYEAVLRLLNSDKLHPAYGQADQALKKLEKENERGGGPS